MHRLSFLSPFPHVQLFLVARELPLSMASENSKDPVKTFNGCLKYPKLKVFFFFFFLSVIQAHFSALLHITQVEKKQTNKQTKQHQHGIWSLLSEMSQSGG